MSQKDSITLESLLEEINEVREKALDSDDYKAALTCTLAKAKLWGGGGMIERRQQQRENPSPFDDLMKMRV